MGLNNFSTQARATGRSIADAFNSNSTVRNSLIGTGIGAGVGAGMGAYSDNGSMVGGMVAGAGVGGLAGAYGPKAYNRVSTMVREHRA